MSYLRYLCLLAHSGVQHILFCFVCLCFVYHLLPFSLDCQFLIAFLVFSKGYLDGMVIFTHLIEIYSSS